MTPVWYAAKVNSPRLWLAWLLLCLLALAAPAQALNGLKLPMSAFSPGSKRACTAKSFRVDCPINNVDPSGLGPLGATLIQEGTAAEAVLAAERILKSTGPRVAPVTVGNSAGLWGVKQIGGAFAIVLLSPNPVGESAAFERTFKVTHSISNGISSLQNSSWSQTSVDVISMGSFATDEDKFYGLVSGLEAMGRKKSQYLSAEQANWIVDQAISYGLEIWTQDGHPNTDWTQRHLHIRSTKNVERRFHIGVPDDYLNSDAILDNKR